MVSLTKAGERHHQLARGGIHPLAHLGFPAPETIQGGGGAASSADLSEANVYVLQGAQGETPGAGASPPSLRDKVWFSNVVCIM